MTLDFYTKAILTIIASMMLIFLVNQKNISLDISAEASDLNEREFYNKVIQIVENNCRRVGSGTGRRINCRNFENRR